MIKILHSADWHLDAPMSGHSEAQTEYLRRELKKVPEKLAQLCAAEHCDLVFLAGDLFDGPWSADTLRTVQEALRTMAVPVFITPGNHDPMGKDSPYTQPGWPENVHIFTQAQMTSVVLPELDCRIYGAGYEGMDCPALLENFQAQGTETWQLGILHGDPTVSASPYCPISRQQLHSCGLHYLALGHIHKADSLRVGDTSCAWPGCPMGRGFDELDAKGAILVTLDGTVRASFQNLDTPRFFDMEIEAGDDPADAVAAVLPALPTQDFYRITLTGYSTGVDTKALCSAFTHIPNLTVRDQTRPEMDLWSAVGEDTLEGVYFGLLQNATEHDSEAVRRRAMLAARISRHILDGQEVKLP